MKMPRIRPTAIQPACLWNLSKVSVTFAPACSAMRTSGGVQRAAATKKRKPSFTRLSFMMPALTKVGTRLPGMNREVTITAMPLVLPNCVDMRSTAYSEMNHLSGALRSAAQDASHQVEEHVPAEDAHEAGGGAGPEVDQAGGDEQAGGEAGRILRD